MTDEEILAVCENFDRYFAELLDVSNEDVAYMSSILLARLVLANNVSGSGDVFRETMQRAIEIGSKYHADLVRH